MKKLISVFLVISIIFTLCGCSLSGNNITLSAGILDEIKTLDPINATGDGEKIISANCFEGLLRTDEENRIYLANATSYSIDKTGCIYTFNLNETAQYHVPSTVKATIEAIGLKDFSKKITAEDYVYGIKRFIASGSDELNFIKGSSSVEELNSDAKIGVEAVDDYTLKITLEKNDPDFLYKLATLPIYPCDQSFYEKAGAAYGTTPATILTNGPYYIEEVNQSETILRRCSDYKGLIEVLNKQIVLYTTGNEKLLKERFENGSYDIYLADSFEEISKGTQSVISETAVWGLAFNCKSKIGSNATLRDILMKTAKFDSVDTPDFATGKADRIIPKNASIYESRNADFAAEKLSYKADAGKAQKLLKALLKKQKAKSFDITFAVPTELSTAAAVMVNNWEIYLSSGINIKVVPYEREKLQEFISTTQYDMAIMPVTPEKQTALSLIEEFYDAPCYYSNDKLYASLYQVKVYDADHFAIYNNAENTIVKSGVFFPLFYTGKILCYADGVKGIYTAENGSLIYFHSGVKAEK